MRLGHSIRDTVLIFPTFHQFILPYSTIFGILHVHFLRILATEKGLLCGHQLIAIMTASGIYLTRLQQSADASSAIKANWDVHGNERMLHISGVSLKKIVS